MSSSPFRLDTRDVVLVLAVALAQVATLVAFLLLLRAVVDAMPGVVTGASGGPGAPNVSVELLWVAAVAVAHGALRGIGFSVSEKAGYRVVQRVRLQMYRHLQGMAPRQIQGRARGGLLLRFVGDLSMLRTWISRGLLNGTVAAIVVGGGVAVLFVLNASIAVSVVAVLATGSAISLGNGRGIRRATRTMRRRRSLLTSNIDEHVNALPVLQVFGRAPGELSRFSRQNDSLNRSLLRIAELRGRLRGVSSTTSLFVTAVVLAVGIVEIRQGRATVGLVVATLLIADQLSQRVVTLGLMHDYWHRSRVSYDKVTDFLRSSTTDLNSPELAPLRVRKGAIELRHVSVPGALTDVTATVLPGQVIAVTGPPGAGKSTLLHLLARMVEPSAGEVVVDGQVLAATTPQSTYRQIGMVSPDLPLVRGTVRRNLTYRDPRAPQEEIRRVVLTTGLDRVLDELPSGMTTWVTEGGRNLSVGQRQWIALARALLGNPPILLLDEPTANLDATSAAAIRDVVKRHDGVVLLVTHEASELSLADQVWVLNGGRLVEVIPGEDYRDAHWDDARGATRHRAPELVP